MGGVERGIWRNPALRLFLLGAGFALLGASNCKDNNSTNVTGPSTFRLSVGLNTLQGNGSSSASSVSADGRYVVFASFANNLASPASSFKDIFLLDRKTGLIENISKVGAISNTALMADCDHPSISPDGRYIVFESAAILGVSGGVNPQTNRTIWLRDLTVSFMTPIVSNFTIGTSWPNADCVTPSVASDGTNVWIVFASAATNINAVGTPGLTGTTNTAGLSQVYATALNTNYNFLVSHSTAGDSTFPNGAAITPRITGDGKNVVFTSTSSDQIAGGSTSGLQAVYMGPPNPGSPGSFLPTSAAPVILVSSPSGAPSVLGLDGNPINGHCLTPTPSSNGNLVVYTTLSTNMVPGGQVADLLLTNIAAQTTVRVASNAAYQAFVSRLVLNGAGFRMGLSDDGLLVAYESGNDQQMYLTNTATGASTLISVNWAGGAGNQPSGDPVMTPDGRWVLWTSLADNLVLDDTNQAADIFGHGPNR